jgi:hypothetical protein
MAAKNHSGKGSPSFIFNTSFKKVLSLALGLRGFAATG